jgi:hypothetical protein
LQQIAGLLVSVAVIGITRLGTPTHNIQYNHPAWKARAKGSLDHPDHGGLLARIRLTALQIIRLTAFHFEHQRNIAQNEKRIMQPHIFIAKNRKMHNAGLVSPFFLLF